MKRVLAFVICLCMAIAVIGCSGKDAAKPAATAAPAPDSAPVSDAAPATDEMKMEFTKFAIGSGSSGGGFFLGASAVSSLLNSKAPDLFEATVEVTGASANNAELIQAGEFKLALCSTDVAWEAYNGVESFADNKCDKLRAVYPGWSGTYIFVTLEENGINNMADFEGKAYSLGTVGSANATVTERVFDTLGISVKKNNLPNADAARGVGDGTLVGFTHSHPSSQVQEMETTHNVKIIELTDDQKALIREKYPPYIWTTIPAGYYKNQPNPIENVGLYNLFITSSDVSEAFVYNLLKVVYGNRDYMETVHAKMAAEMDVANIGMTTIPYHPGAVKFFREMGVEIPDALIPPEMK